MFLYFSILQSYSGRIVFDEKVSPSGTVAYSVFTSGDGRPASTVKQAWSCPGRMMMFLFCSTLLKLYQLSRVISLIANLTSAAQYSSVRQIQQKIFRYMYFPQKIIFLYLQRALTLQQGKKNRYNASGQCLITFLSLCIHKHRSPGR